MLATQNVVFSMLSLSNSRTQAVMVLIKSAEKYVFLVQVYAFHYSTNIYLMLAYVRGIFSAEITAADLTEKIPAFIVFMFQWV